MGKAAGSRPVTAANTSGAITVPIRRLLENHVFGPEEITVLTTAFEDTLRALHLADRADPATEIHRQEDHRARPARRARSRTFARTRDSISVAIDVAGGGSAGVRDFNVLR